MTFINSIEKVSNTQEDSQERKLQNVTEIIIKDLNKWRDVYVH